ncbi:MAG: hypothetical protein ACREI7_00250 [Myxococcota bacterium]
MTQGDERFVAEMFDDRQRQAAIASMSRLRDWAFGSAVLVTVILVASLFGRSGSAGGWIWLCALVSWVGGSQLESDLRLLRVVDRLRQESGSPAR